MPAKKESSERRGLDEHGIIFLSGAIDGGTAESICEKIIEFNVGHEVDLIQLMINSGGGECSAGFAVIVGNHSELVARRKEEDLLHRRLVDHYLAFSNLASEEEVTQRLLRDVDTWLTPEEAVEVGIADKVQEDRPARRGGVEVRR